jgi:hypothetical protein
MSLERLRREPDATMVADRFAMWAALKFFPFGQGIR